MKAMRQREGEGSLSADQCVNRDCQRRKRKGEKRRKIRERRKEDENGGKKS